MKKEELVNKKIQIEATLYQLLERQRILEQQRFQIIQEIQNWKPKEVKKNESKSKQDDKSK